MRENFYAILAPLVLSMILVEFAWSLYKRNGHYKFKDSVTNLATAIGNQVIVIWQIALSYLALDYLYRMTNLRIENNLLNFILLNILLDFLFYWNHRFGHTVNIMWAAHAPHHSSEEFNYTVGLRTGLFQRLFYFPFLMPLALLGFEPEMILSTVAIQHVIQLIPHTRWIKNYGPMDKIINSPSHHRVHHAKNICYRDKNFAGILIIWDKLFGTYAEEIEPVEYGVARRVDSWNIITINFQYWKIWWEDMQDNKGLLNKIKVSFMPAATYRKRSDSHKSKSITTSKIPKAQKIFVLLQIPLAIYLMLQITDAQTGLSLTSKLILSLIVWGIILSWNLLISKRVNVPVLGGIVEE